MNVLICDDSALARKSLHRCIVSHFTVTTFFCENGQQAIATLSENNIDLLFLDLTMPIMDGYEVLASLPVNSYPTKVVIVSGDIQEEARNRCFMMGASDFIAKPFAPEVVYSIISETSATVASGSPYDREQEVAIDPVSKFKEITNIALGRGAAVISDRIGEFIDLPVPTVGTVEASELNMIISDALQRTSIHAVTQRFVGNGICGESLVCMRGNGVALLGERLGFSAEDSTNNELVMNVANLLVSTFLNSLSHQLVIKFSLRQPAVVDKDIQAHLIDHQIHHNAFTVEFTYFAEKLDFECEILLLLDSDSTGTLFDLMERL